MPINKPWLEFNADNVAQVPKTDGVFELGNLEGLEVFIGGTSNLRESLKEHLNSDDPCLRAARFFRYEETFMYTLRESELLQRFIRQNRRLPECNI